MSSNNGIQNSIKKLTVTPARFKINLEKHFVSCAKNNSLWEAFTEFKQKTENDEIFANSVSTPTTRKEMNKVILDAFLQIDTSTTKYKYYQSMSKLKNRYKNNLDLFCNSNIETKKDSFMDNIMQEIIDRDISFLAEKDRKQFEVLFFILQSPNFNNQSEKFKALDDLNKNVFPDNSALGKFSSIKIADKFRHLNELCKKISNYQSFIISSTAVNTPGLAFDEALNKFRLDLKKSCIPAFEVANMYTSSLGIKPLDIASFIIKQEELFVNNFKQKNPNIEVNYSRPNLDEVYPFVNFSKNSLNNSHSVNNISYVKKSAISQNLQRAQHSIKDLYKQTQKLSKHAVSYAKHLRMSKIYKPKNINKNADKNKQSDIIKSSRIGPMS